MSLSCDGVFRLCQESQFLRHAHTNLNGLSGPSTQSTQLYFYYVSPHLPHILTVIIYLCNSEQSSCLAADNPTCPLLYALMPILADTSPQHGPCWLKWQISSSAGSAEQERWGFFFFEKFIATLTLAVGRVCLFVFDLILSLQVFAQDVCFLKSLKEICISVWHWWPKVSGNFVWLTPDTWLRQLVEAKMTGARTDKGILCLGFNKAWQVSQQRREKKSGNEKTAVMSCSCYFQSSQSKDIFTHLTL